MKKKQRKNNKKLRQQDFNYKVYGKNILNMKSQKITARKNSA